MNKLYPAVVGNNQYLCQIINCNASFSSEQDFMDHNMGFLHSPCNQYFQMQDIRPPFLPCCFLCPQCDEQFNTHFNCQNHMLDQLHLPFYSPLIISAFMCAQCLHLFKNMILCMEHMDMMSHYQVHFPFHDDKWKPGPDKGGRERKEKSRVMPIPIPAQLVHELLVQCSRTKPTVKCLDCDLVIESHTLLEQHHEQTQYQHKIALMPNSNLVDIVAGYMTEFTMTCDVCHRLLNDELGELRKPAWHRCAENLVGIVIQNDARTFAEFMKRLALTLIKTVELDNHKEKALIKLLHHHFDAFIKQLAKQNPSCNYSYLDLQRTIPDCCIIPELGTMRRIIHKGHRTQNCFCLSLNTLDYRPETWLPELFLEWKGEGTASLNSIGCIIQDQQKTRTTLKREQNILGYSSDTLTSNWFGFLELMTKGKTKGQRKRLREGNINFIPQSESNSETAVKYRLDKKGKRRGGSHRDLWRQKINVILNSSDNLLNSHENTNGKKAKYEQCIDHMHVNEMSAGQQESHNLNLIGIVSTGQEKRQHMPRSVAEKNCSSNALLCDNARSVEYFCPITHVDQKSMSAVTVSSANVGPQQSHDNEISANSDKISGNPTKTTSAPENQLNVKVSVCPDDSAINRNTDKMPVNLLEHDALAFTLSAGVTQHQSLVPWLPPQRSSDNASHINCPRSWDSSLVTLHQPYNASDNRIKESHTENVSSNPHSESRFLNEPCPVTNSASNNLEPRHCAKRPRTSRYDVQTVTSKQSNQSFPSCQNNTVTYASGLKHTDSLTSSQKHKESSPSSLNHTESSPSSLKQEESSPSSLKHIVSLPSSLKQEKSLPSSEKHTESSPSSQQRKQKSCEYEPRQSERLRKKKLELINESGSKLETARSPFTPCPVTNSTSNNLEARPCTKPPRTSRFDVQTVTSKQSNQSFPSSQKSLTSNEKHKECSPSSLKQEESLPSSQKHTEFSSFSLNQEDSLPSSQQRRKKSCAYGPKRRKIIRQKKLELMNQYLLETAGSPLIPEVSLHWCKNLENVVEPDREVDVLKNCFETESQENVSECSIMSNSVSHECTEMKEVSGKRSFPEMSINKMEFGPDMRNSQPQKLYCKMISIREGYGTSTSALQHEEIPTSGPKYEETLPPVLQHETASTSALQHKEIPTSGPKHEEILPLVLQHETSSSSALQHEAIPTSGPKYEETLPFVLQHETASTSALQHKEIPTPGPKHERTLRLVLRHETSSSSALQHEAIPTSGPKYEETLSFVLQHETASTSALQHKEIPTPGPKHERTLRLVLRHETSSSSALQHEAIPTSGPKYEETLSFVLQHETASTSALQHKEIPTSGPKYEETLPPVLQHETASTSVLQYKEIPTSGSKHEGTLPFVLQHETASTSALQHKEIPTSGSKHEGTLPLVLQHGTTLVKEKNRMHSRSDNSTVNIWEIPLPGEKKKRSHRQHWAEKQKDVVLNMSRSDNPTVNIWEIPLPGEKKKRSHRQRWREKQNDIVLNLSNNSLNTRDKEAGEKGKDVNVTSMSAVTVLSSNVGAQQSHATEKSAKSPKRTTVSVISALSGSMSSSVRKNESLCSSPIPLPNTHPSGIISRKTLFIDNHFNHMLSSSPTNLPNVIVSVYPNDSTINRNTERRPINVLGHNKNTERRPINVLGHDALPFTILSEVSYCQSLVPTLPESRYLNKPCPGPSGLRNNFEPRHCIQRPRTSSWDVQTITSKQSNQSSTSLQKITESSTSRQKHEESKASGQRQEESLASGQKYEKSFTSSQKHKESLTSCRRHEETSALHQKNNQSSLLLKPVKNLGGRQHRGLKKTLQKALNNSNNDTRSQDNQQGTSKQCDVPGTSTQGNQYGTCNQLNGPGTSTQCNQHGLADRLYELGASKSEQSALRTRENHLSQSMLNSLKKVAKSSHTPYLISTEYLKTMKNMVFLDLDNWGGFFQRLPRCLPQGTFVWGFYGGTLKWRPPEGCFVYNRMHRMGMFYLNDQCGTTKDAADFAIVLTVGKMNERLPVSVAFTILSGDKGFYEVERQMRHSERRVKVIDPHDAERISSHMVYVMVTSVTET